MQVFNTNNLLNGVVSNAIFAFLCWLATKLSKVLERRSPAYRRLLLLVLAILWILLNIFLYKNLHGSEFLFASILSFSVAAFFTWKELNQFWQIGLIGADPRFLRVLTSSEVWISVRTRLNFWESVPASLRRKATLTLRSNSCCATPQTQNYKP